MQSLGTSLKSAWNRVASYSAARLRAAVNSRFLSFVWRWRYEIGLGVIISGAACLYFYDLGNYGFQMDEFYHAREVKTFLETGKLFYTGDIPYGRSKITTLLALASHLSFAHLPFHLTEEFVLRFPIVLIALLNIVLVYFIAKNLMPKTVALAAASFMASETYVMYFAVNLRFYTPGIFFILLLLYINIKSQKRSYLIYSAVFSVLLYFLLTEYFLFIAAFFAGVYLYKTVIDFNALSKTEKFISIILVGLLFTAGISILAQRFITLPKYNLVTWAFNASKFQEMGYWLVLNYGLFLFSALISLVSLLKDLRKSWKLEINAANLIALYCIGNVLFILGYIVNVQFGFTFRVTIFVLPLLFILFFKNAYTFINDKFVLALIFIVLITSNLFYSLKYHLNETGDYYAPTKLVQEKINVLTGNKDLAEYINNSASNLNPDSVAIGYIGLGDNSLQYYLANQLNNFDVAGFRSSSNSNPTVIDLENFLKQNADKYVYVVVSANAQSNRLNTLYVLVYGKPYVTEVSSKLGTYIDSDKDFKKIYVSDDGFSDIYLRPPLSQD